MTPKAKTVNKFLRPGLHTLFLNKQNGLAKQNVVLLKVLKIGASICLFFFFFFFFKFGFLRLLVNAAVWAACMPLCALRLCSST